MKLKLGMLTLLVTFVGSTILSEVQARDSASLRQDPVWIVRTFGDALNRRDVNGALALFADHAVLVDPAHAGSADRTVLRNWLQSQACENDRSELSDLWVSSEAVTWTARVHRGDAVLGYQYHAEVKDGRITHLMFVGDTRADASYAPIAQTNLAGKSLGEYATNIAHTFDIALQCQRLRTSGADG